MEEATGQAVDWSDSSERNLLMFESAEPLARLYSPWYQVDDTFVLQEYFVPKSQFRRWIKQSAPIYAAAAEADLINLLNTTIRFVRKDEDSFLKYSSCDEGCFAFVLYYRLQRSEAGDAELKSIHEMFTALTLKLGGTMYLPYRHHYSEEDLLTAYPMVRDFVEKKRHYDPHGIFVNRWYLKYLQHLTPEGKSAMVKPMEPVHIEPDESFELPIVSDRRSDSYRKLFKNLKQRRLFVDGFLTQVIDKANPCC